MKEKAKDAGARWSMKDLRAQGFIAKFDEFKGGDMVLWVDGGELVLSRNDGDLTPVWRGGKP